MSKLYWALVLVVSLWAGPCLGAVQRFAVVIGNNLGDVSDVELRYAESDAGKVANVLRDLGGVQPADIVMLRGEDSDTVRSTLIALNARIRASQSSPNDQTLLFVYYSGHADSTSLRLGATRFPFRELAQLVKGSAATFRLLVVDSCRSGTLTRIKGTRVVEPFRLETDSRLRGQGMAFLTATSADEDAQESDRIRGSFFTHALVSGLLGAADTNADGNVVLEEVYRHARDATVRTTSRTFAGTQHPNFQYELRGQDSLVLTRPGRADAKRGQLVVPENIGFLLMRDNSRGAIVAEVSSSDLGRRLSLRPGLYFLRGRGQSYLLEGVVQVRAGISQLIELDELNRVQYAQLVRKGVGERGLASSVQLGPQVRAPLPNSSGVCWGLGAEVRLALPIVTFGSQWGGCTSSLRGGTVDGRTDEYGWTLTAEHVWDLSSLSLSAGLGAGATFFHQSFDTNRLAPSRDSLAPLALVVFRMSQPINNGIHWSATVRGEGHLLNFQAQALDEPGLQAAYTTRLILGLGQHF